VPKIGLCGLGNQAVNLETNDPCTWECEGKAGYTTVTGLEASLSSAQFLDTHVRRTKVVGCHAQVVAKGELYPCKRIFSLDPISSAIR
jgi:hypothetical protein